MALDQGKRKAETATEVAEALAKVMAGMEAMQMIVRRLKDQPDLPVPSGVEDGAAIRRCMAVSLTEAEKLMAYLLVYVFSPYQKHLPPPKE